MALSRRIRAESSRWLTPLAYEDPIAVAVSRENAAAKSFAETSLLCAFCRHYALTCSLVLALGIVDH